MDVEAWAAQIERERTEEDRFFAGHWQSPIPAKDRAEFGGLDYYPPDPDYRFEIELYERGKKNPVRMAYTRGKERDFARWGEFRFSVGGEQCVLQAYRRNTEEERLFIPFRDAKSGHGTYGAVRYLDLTVARDRTPDGKWIVDLNQAYNPWCAYSKDFICPFVPQENWLTVPVRAGEKDYARS